MAATSNCVSLAAPFRVGAVRLEWCLILWILNEDLKCLELRVAVHVKHTFQKKVSCLEVPSTSVSYSTGSNPGQWVIQVSGTDSVSTLLHTYYKK